MRHYIRYCILILGILTGACQVLNAPNVPATLSAQNTAFAAEASEIPLSFGATAIAIESTAVAAQTTVAEVGSINRQLIATLKVVVPPTIKPQISTEGMIDSTTPSGTNAAVLTDLAVTDLKRESDGCADGTRTQFPADVPIIYATTRAISISSGSVVAVEWKYQSQVVSSGTYTLPSNETNFCIWFPLDSANVSLLAGSWSVDFMLNGNPVNPSVFFTIGE